MKLRIISTITIVVIVIMTSVGVFIEKLDVNPENQRASINVVITNIVSNPQILHPKERFSINGTIYNPNPYTINFDTDSISAKFDKNMITIHYPGCSNVVESRVIRPLQSVEFTLPHGCETYFANSTGTSNAIIGIAYVAVGSVHTVMASKNFTISQPLENRPRETQMELKAYGFACCGLDGDLLKGYLSTSNSFVSNATVQISINGITMGYAKTFSDGCFQFNQWNESKLAEQTDAFLENEKKWGVYKPFNLTFTAHFAGDKNYGPSTMQTASAMSLTAVPMASPQLETILTPQQVNLTQGSSANFQIHIRPLVEQWNVPHLNLYLQGYPCETYFRLSQSSDNNTASTIHPALFDGTMSASTDSPSGKYFVHMLQKGTNHLVSNDIGTFPLNVMKMK